MNIKKYIASTVIMLLPVVSLPAYSGPSDPSAWRRHASNNEHVKVATNENEQKCLVRKRTSSSLKPIGRPKYVSVRCLADTSNMTSTHPEIKRIKK
ncbi:hypothetical protein [Alteromonas macleodii]|uniref:hypothetical protein n=1 Tax=Alteromonas macleodii TaxID=28108 RepID=UPI0008593734|nr:hypothetical protein [Alteromonas macleodii]